MVKFFYHYNKPKSKQVGYPVISIHYRDTCHFVKSLKIDVPTNSKINKRQPYFVMVGNANKISIKNKIAYVS